MDTEKRTPDKRPLEERMNDCPIHRWAESAFPLGVNGYLISCIVPSRLWGIFQELIIVRGRYYPLISDIDAKEFAKKAIEITKDNDALEMHNLKILFQNLIQMWKDDSVRVSN